MNEIVGYIYERAAYHPECLPEGIDPSGEEVRPVAEWDEDDIEALTCDACLTPLVDDDCQLFCRQMTS